MKITVKCNLCGKSANVNGQKQITAWINDHNNNNHSELSDLAKKFNNHIELIYPEN